MNSQYRWLFSLITVSVLLLSTCKKDRNSGNITDPNEEAATPEANFTASPKSGMYPLTVTFDGSTSSPYNSTIVSYDWKFGDGATASGQIVTHEYKEPGLYTVALTVTNAAGGTHERVITDMIDANRTIWRHDVDKPIYYSAPAVGDDGTIYVSTGILGHTNFGRVHAVNPDGTSKWIADLDENTPPPDGTGRADNNGSSPAIGPDGAVYVVDHRNAIYAFDPATGQRKWTNSTYESDNIWYVGQKTPAISNDGTLYICADYTLYALRPTDGSEIWHYDMRRGNYCATSAVIDQNGIIYIASNEWFYAFNPDGSLHWPEPYIMPLYNEKSLSSPAIGSDGVIYFGTEVSGSTGYVYALNSDGTLKWRYEVPGKRHVRASPAIASDGTIYVTTKAYLDESSKAQPAYCLAFRPDGSVKWIFEIPPIQDWIATDSYTSPAIGADGTIYFAAEDGFIYALNPDGTVLWKENFHNTINWSSPMIMDDGTLYIGGNRNDIEGRLVAVQTQSFGLDSGPWPKFRKNTKNTGRMP